MLTFLKLVGIVIRLANSPTAFNWIAFTLPIPLICVNSSIVILRKKLIPSELVSFKFNIFCANCTEVSCLVPVLIIIASNSAFDNAFSPYHSSFS